MGLDMGLFKKNLKKPEKDRIDISWWYNANHIHKWFVENVQHGEDNCEDYIVSPSQLKELLKICKQIHKTKNIKLAKSLLPTTDEFFFGSIDYDEHYFDNIKDTIDILTEILEQTDFNNEEIYYVSY